mgnify:CR=1 FL=1
MSEELFVLPLEEALPILRAFGHYLRWGSAQNSLSQPSEGTHGRKQALLGVQPSRQLQRVPRSLLVVLLACMLLVALEAQRSGSQGWHLESLLAPGPLH